MIDDFISFLNESIELNKEEIDFVKETISIRKIDKGNYLLKAGEISTAFFFNLQGFIRLFYLKDGEEKTAYFYPEKTFISAYSSFTKQEPSRMNLQATEKSVVVEISLEASIKLLGFSPKFDLIARLAMEEELINHQRMVEALLTMSPENRYYQLM